jgi:hypothetical protein
MISEFHPSLTVKNHANQITIGIQPPRFMLKLETLMKAAEKSPNILAKLEPEICIRYKPHYRTMQGKFWWTWVLDQCKKHVSGAGIAEEQIDLRPLLTEETLKELDDQLAKEKESDAVLEGTPALYEVWERKRWYLVDGRGMKLWDEELWLSFVESSKIVDPTAQVYTLDPVVVNREGLDRMVGIKLEYHPVSRRRWGTRRARK